MCRIVTDERRSRCGKSSPPLRGRSERPAGRCRWLACSECYTLLCTPSRRAASSDPDRCRAWVWALAAQMALHQSEADLGEERMSGGCACSKVRFDVRIDNDDAYLCHCRMCQRATGSLSIAFKQVMQADVNWMQGPDWYDSSPIARRPYCASCGTSLGFVFKEGSDKMDLTVASFDDPSRFKPKWHFGAESIHRDWLNTEGLPEHKTSDYDVLVEKWIEATGAVP